MDITALKSKRAKIKVYFDGEEIICEIKPNVLTPEFWARLQELSTATEADKENSDVLFLADLMADWNITAGDEPFPPTQDNLRQAPIALLGAIAREVLDYVGKQAAANNASD